MTLNFNTEKIYIIAEIGVNHNGNISLAKKLIKEAKNSGADAVKFQSFKTDALVTRFAKQAPYQKKNLGMKEQQFKMLKRYELKDKDYKILYKECQKLKIDFISSVFDEGSVDFIKKKIKSKIIKIPSGEINNYLILRKLSLSNYKILISTGMSNYKEIVKAINTIANKKVFIEKNKKIKIIDMKLFKKIKKRICIMHCVTDYPVVKKQANLKCINNIKNDFKLIVGYSDHTLGVLAPIIAVSKGAKIIEKHFTLNKKMKGPDHLASLEPKELSEMVKNIRDFESMEGDGKKHLQRCEQNNLKVARKSIVAKTKIRINEKFTYKNLTVKRPGTGLDPFKIKKLINKTSKRNYNPDQLILKV
ncbi:N-acetylneuraminate synthase [Candidatus Pelagibacter ubique]|jgi:N-acetylneuraminate synthase|nr:N-acetylneuraminate synthase [Candidatus Pelagibacter ubique]